MKINKIFIHRNRHLSHLLPPLCTCSFKLFSENRVTSEREYRCSKIVDEVGRFCYEKETSVITS